MIKKGNNLRLGNAIFIVENVLNDNYLLRNISNGEINWVSKEDINKHLEKIKKNNILENNIYFSNDYLKIITEEQETNTTIRIITEDVIYSKKYECNKSKALYNFGKYFNYTNELTPYKLKKHGFINESFIIICEGIADILKYYPKIPEEKVKELVALDPTYKGGDQLGKFGKWILNIYNRGNLKEEDFYKVKDYLTTFKQNYNKMTNKDLNTYKSLPELYTAIEPYIGQQDVSHRQEVMNIKQGAEKVFEDDNWLVIVPHTEEASCYYGKGTQWCTAATKSDNMFNDYNDRGPLYININKKTNEKYQFHFETNSFMDEKDKGINFKEFLQNNPDLKKFYFNLLLKTPDKYASALVMFFGYTRDENINRLAVQRTGYAIAYIEKPSKELQRLAVQKNGEYIQYIKSPSEELQRLAVRQDGGAIAYIENPSEELQRLAVEEDGRVIQCIENPSEEVQRLVVRIDAEYISYIKNPSEEVQKLAVQQDMNAIKYIKNPSEEVQKLAVQQNGYVIKFIENPSEEVQKLAVQQKGEYILYIHYPSKEVQRLAIKDDGNNIQFIKNPSEEFIKLAIDSGATLPSFYDSLPDEWKLYAIDKRPTLIYNINNLTDEMIMKSIKIAPYLIIKLKNPSEETLKQAVDIKYRTLAYMENIPESVQMYAVKKSWTNIRYIENPCKEAQMYAVKKGGSDAYRKIVNPCKEATDYIKSMKMYNLDESFDGISSNENFMKWFGDSMIVDSRGEPLICYHCSNQQFDDFDEDMIGRRDCGWYGKGIYFSPYQNDHYGQYCKECYLRIENPYYCTGDSEIDCKVNDLYELLVPYELYNRINEFKQRRKDFIKNSTVIKKPSNYPNLFYYTVKYNGQEWSDGDLYNPKLITDDCIKIQALESGSFGSYVADVRKFEKTLDNYIDNMVRQKGFKDKGELKTAKLISLGYDGVIVGTRDNLKDPEMADEIVVFRKNQIKSVENNGNFSLGEDNINEEADE